MTTTPETWRKYALVAAFVKAECANCVDGRCICDHVPVPGRKAPPKWHCAVGGGAHGYASLNCPHWIAAQCTRKGHERECPLHDWYAGVEPCQWFEENLLPTAPREVGRDYAYRTGPAGEGGIATEGRCVLMRREPVRCAYFEQALLPAAPPRVAEEYSLAFPGVRAAADRFQAVAEGMSDRECPQCGAPLPKRKRLCEGCRKAARRRTRREAQARWRGKADRPAPV